MATQSPEEILTKLLQNGQVVDPYAPVDATPYTPQYGRTPQQQAQDTVDLQYNSQQRALQEAARQAAQENTYQRSVEQGYGKIVDPRLANVYSALGNTLTQDRAATQENYQGAIDKIRGYYDEASQSGAGVNSDILNRLTQSAQQLGVGAAVPDATKQLMSDYQFNQGQLASGKAGRSANLAQAAASFFGLDTGRISAAAQEGAQQRAQVQQEVLRTLGDLLRQNQKEQGSYRSQISGLLGDKAIDLRKTIEDITESRSKDSVQARKDALEEFLSRAGLAQQNEQMQAGLAGSMLDRQIQQQQFAQQLAAQRAKSSGGGGSGSPLADIYKLAQIQGIQSLIGQRGTTTADRQKALETFLSTPSDYWKVPNQSKYGFGITNPLAGTSSGDKAGPKFTSAINQIINNANTAAAQRTTKDPVTGKLVNTPAQDPYQLALAQIAAYPSMNQNALRAGLDAYYKGTTTPGSGDPLVAALLMGALGG